MPLECLDKCPHCGEILWIEWGYFSVLECMMQYWCNYAYNFERVIEVEEAEYIEEVD